MTERRGAFPSRASSVVTVVIVKLAEREHGVRIRRKIKVYNVLHKVKFRKNFSILKGADFVDGRSQSRNPHPVYCKIMTKKSLRARS